MTKCICSNTRNIHETYKNRVNNSPWTTYGKYNSLHLFDDILCVLRLNRLAVVNEILMIVPAHRNAYDVSFPVDIFVAVKIFCAISFSILCTTCHVLVLDRVSTTPGTPGNLLEFDAPGNFNCQLEYDTMPITEPNLVTSLNPRNWHLTIFVQFYL